MSGRDAHDFLCVGIFGTITRRRVIAQHVTRGVVPWPPERRAEVKEEGDDGVNKFEEEEAGTGIDGDAEGGDLAVYKSKYIAGGAPVIPVVPLVLVVSIKTVVISFMKV